MKIVTETGRVAYKYRLFSRLYHMLPEGDPARHEVENIRYMCNSCYKAIVRHGAPVEIGNEPKEGEEK